MSEDHARHARPAGTDEAGEVAAGSRDAAGADAGAGDKPDSASRRAAAVVAVVLCALLAVVVAVTTPWHPLPGAHGTPGPALDFTPAEIAR
ncbi:MAG TPA: hypothetical protein VE198_12525, partial [Actinoallomurus sp.]|nr:hypothetical protein [Actinoallomurus sp.]